MRGYLQWNDQLSAGFNGFSFYSQQYMRIKWIIFFLFFISSSVLAQHPVIHSINKNTASPNEIITIVGERFSEENNELIVRFGAVNGEISYSSKTVLEVIVPEESSYRPISVTNLISGLTAYAISPFTMAYGGETLTENSFSGQLNFPAAPGLNDICLCDLNGDQKTDVVATNISGNAIAVFTNTSSLPTIDFGDEVLRYNLASPTSDIICQDMDGDGKPEIIASSYSESSIYILKNNSSPGDYNFGSPQRVPLNGVPAKIASGDANLDGKPELIISHELSNSITILENKSEPGIIQFNNEIALLAEEAENSSDLAVADLNRDGMPDIVLGQSSGNDLFIFQNQSQGGEIIFSNERRFGVTGKVTNLTAIDFDGDNRQDIVATLVDVNEIRILLNNTIETGDDIRFSSALAFDTDEGSRGIGVGDLDGDGKPDLAIAANKSITLYKNNSTPGILSLQKITLPTDESNQFINAGDINGDGKPDLVFTSIDNFRLSVLKNTNCFEAQVRPLGPVTICEGSSVRLESNQLPGITYIWLKGNEEVKSGNEAFFEVEKPGNYTLQTSEEGVCTTISNTVEIAVADGDIPAVPEATSNSPVCHGEQLMLFATEVPGAQYEWRGPGNFISNEQNPVIEEFSQVNSGRYHLQIIQGECRSEEVSLVVEVVDAPPPAITATADKNNVNSGEMVQLNASGAFIYRWFPETGLSNPNIANPVATIDTTITYTVTGKDMNGCSDSAEITVVVENTLNVKPRKLFSPNGDRIDDYWQIEGIEKFPDCNVIIFNRQGKEILEQRPYLNDWNGTFNGENLPEGVYYYVIRCHGAENAKTGSITLIR